MIYYYFYHCLLSVFNTKFYKVAVVMVHLICITCIIIVITISAF